MQPYFERAVQVACESSISCLVLLSSGNDDIELLRITPQPSADFVSPEVFAARQLRNVGVVGLCGTKPTVAFKEPLEPPVVNAIAMAFLEYLRVLLGESLAEQTEAFEIAELERLYSLNTLPN